MTKIETEIAVRFANITRVTFTEKKGAGFGRSGYAVNRRTTAWGFDGVRWVQIPVRVGYAFQALGLDVHVGYVGSESAADGWPHR